MLKHGALGAKERTTKMDKTFLIAGTSTFNNVNTFRFANGKPNLRANMLRFNGHTDIELVELPKPMTKLQAIAYLTQKGTEACLLYTSPSPRDRQKSRMPSSA